MFKKTIKLLAVLNLLSTANLLATALQEDLLSDPDFVKCIRYERQQSLPLTYFVLALDCSYPILHTLHHTWPRLSQDQAVRFLGHLKTYQGAHGHADYPLPLPADLSYALNMLARKGIRVDGSLQIWVDMTDHDVKILPRLLGCLTGLKRLNLSGTQVRDLSPLSNLNNLKEFYLSGTQVRDLSPLSKLFDLKQLSLCNTPVHDLAPLSNLTGLNWLDLSGTQVHDLTPLSNLNALNWLDLSGTQVFDLSPLGKLTGLKTLVLDGTPAILPENLQVIRAVFGSDVQICIAHTQWVHGTRP